MAAPARAPTVGAMLRQNAPLKSIAEARPQEQRRATAPAAADVSVPDQWESLGALLDAALRERAARAPNSSPRVRLVHERAGKLGQRHVDASLYHLIHAAGHSTAKLQQPPCAAGHAGVRTGRHAAGLEGPNPCAAWAAPR